MTADRFLWLVMRFDAVVLLCAVPCAFIPFAWMDAVNRHWLGLDPLPDAPITRYLTRTLSLMYALHGALVWTVTVRWEQYRSLVPVFAWLHAALGCAILITDLQAGVPTWWTAGEGPGLVAFGFVKLLLYRRATRTECRRES